MKAREGGTFVIKQNDYSIQPFEYPLKTFSLIYFYLFRKKFKNFVESINGYHLAVDQE